MPSTSLTAISYSLLWILVALGMGKFISSFLPLLPASLYGMILLALALHLKLAKASYFGTTIGWIIRHMGICFVPAGIGIVEYPELIVQFGFAIIIFIFLATMGLVTLVAWLSEKLLKT